MTILFASGDIGGARALLPVMHVCAKKRIPFVLLAHGHLTYEAPQSWPRVYVNGDCTDETIQALLQSHGIDRLAFTSSVHDTLPLSMARTAKQLGIPVMHVLDNWTAYRRRLEMDGLPTLMPDVYTVMDEAALQAAIRDGIAASVLEVTGQPALACLAEDYRALSTDEGRARRQRLGCTPERFLLVFVAEPVAQDQGASAEAPQYRGYTEQDVLDLYCRHIQPYAERVHIALLPHPRQNHDALSRLWRCYRRKLQGGICTGMPGREAVWLADGVAGMASLLLYEAWLLGKPVISLQPGLRQNALRMLQQRQGVVFVDTTETAEQAIGKWVEAIQPGRQPVPRSDLDAHQAAPDNIVTLLLEGKRTCR
jgi:hypothetical protein